MAKTATWTWPDRYSSLRLVEFTKADREYIASLAVGWSITETGAPELMQTDGEWLSELFEDDTEKEGCLSLFLHKAELPNGRYTMENPYLGKELMPAVLEDAFYGYRDKATKTAFLNDPVLELEVTDTLKKLWVSCDVRAYGFDPKRGFQLTELQQIIDPGKQLSKKEVSQEKKRYKGLLFRYLLFLVRKGSLQTGWYHSHNGHVWSPGKDYALAVERNACEWWQHLNSDFFQGIGDFVQLMCALTKLVKHLAPTGGMTYNEVAATFNFQRLFRYDSDNMGRLDISLEEILLKLLEHFPEENTLVDESEGCPLVLVLVRIYNAQGRFKEAHRLLQAAGLDLFTEKQLEFFCTGPNRYEQLAFYESCICRMASTGNYNLWRFPQFPKFTEAEFEEFELYKGAYLRGSKEHRLEEQKIEKALRARPNLGMDMRKYLDFRFFNDLESIYAHLEENQMEGDLDQLLVAVIGQIHLLSELGRR
ncbi:hypothetical protein [Maribacter sp. 2307ULW6-5]|uniref:hypothetical protein n=1 Tax=Maribacter sp. 2307ULW6-5 TaxID=3386275 RepID=UPI0039BD417E